MSVLSLQSKRSDAGRRRSAEPEEALTGREAEIMKIVQDHDSVTVRDVYETLRKRRKVAYTTTMTTMSRLEIKGHLQRSLRGRAYLYRKMRS